MKLSFKSESDFTGANMKKFENALQNTSVLLHHANFCWHCQAMRGEFEEFKKAAKHPVVEVESAALDKLKQYPTIYRRATPGDGSMYFPMIVVFVRKVGMSPKRYIYQGPRTSEAIKAFVEKKSSPARPASAPASPLKPSAAARKPSAAPRKPSAAARKPSAAARKPSKKAYKKKPVSAK